MQIEDFKIRASAASKLMPKPRNKKDKLAKTTLTYIDEWIKERVYGIKKEFTSKYTDKGNILEDLGISKAIEWLDLDFVIKNEKYFESDLFCGTPDLILEDEVLDIKCSWDAFSFPLLEDELPNKDYYYQMQVYMNLTGKKKSRVVYVLLNTPENISQYETHHDYSKIDPKLRIKTFAVEYDPAVIDELTEKVILTREKIAELWPK